MGGFCSGGFVQGDFVRGDFVLGGILSRGILSGGFCPGGFCPGGFCPRTPRDIPQKIPAPRAKIRMQKPQSGGEFSVQIPGGARGGMVMAKIDNCISGERMYVFILPGGWCGNHRTD